MTIANIENKVLKKMQSGLNKIVNNYQVNKDDIQLKNGINELIKEGKKKRNLL